MTSLLKNLLSNHFKLSSNRSQTDGFTLIELLVAMILAVLVITPLMGFMINVMDSDRREQAKINSEQEMKGALDYIKRDLEQAVYIYDADGITAIGGQLPQRANSSPILVFWKREYIPNVISVSTTDTTQKDDTFVYSLVAYYLINEPYSNNSIWSRVARIGRFQMKDGYGASRTGIDQGFRGFTQLLSQESGDLKTKMNKWTNAGYGPNTPQIFTLVDYVDKTPTDTTNTCSTPPTTTPPTPPMQLISGTKGFYVCVGSDVNNNVNTVAEVYLRGNALARIQNDNIEANAGNTSYFPQATTRVQGRGFVFTK